MVGTGNVPLRTEGWDEGEAAARFTVPGFDNPTNAVQEHGTWADEGKAVGSRACRRLCLFEPLWLMPARRFPPPWSVEELDACFVVRVNRPAKESVEPRRTCPTCRLFQYRNGPHFAASGRRGCDTAEFFDKPIQTLGCHVVNVAGQICRDQLH